MKKFISFALPLLLLIAACGAEKHVVGTNTTVAVDESTLNASNLYFQSTKNADKSISWKLTGAEETDISKLNADVLRKQVTALESYIRAVADRFSKKNLKYQDSVTLAKKWAAAKELRNTLSKQLDQLNGGDKASTPEAEQADRTEQPEQTVQPAQPEQVVAEQAAKENATATQKLRDQLSNENAVLQEQFGIEIGADGALGGVSIDSLNEQDKTALKPILDKFVQDEAALVTYKETELGVDVNHQQKEDAELRNLRATLTNLKAAYQSLDPEDTNNEA